MTKSCVWITIGFVALFGCTPREREKHIWFDQKAFSDFAGTLYVAGTLTGEGVEYPNNTTAIVCYQDRAECISYGIAQIGPDLLERLDAPTAYAVTKWSPDEVVATLEYGTGSSKCRRVTISILRQTDTAVWVEEPINQAAAACRNADTRLLKWTIEDPPYWKNGRGKPITGPRGSSARGAGTSGPPPN